MSATALTRDELTAWSRYIHEICGVFLDDSKGYLIETRMGGLLRENGLGGWSELLYKVKGDPSNAMRTKVINAITTNETSFFRDTSPFEMLQHKIFPELIDHPRPRRQLGADHLEHDRRAQLMVLGLVNASHAPVPDLFDDGVSLAELLARIVPERFGGRGLMGGSIGHGRR